MLVFLSALFIISVLFLFLGTFARLRENKEVINWLTVWGMLAFVCGIGAWEEFQERENIVVCTGIGVVVDSICAIEESHDKFHTRWAECRVLLDSGMKLNLTPHNLAMKGDKIVHCTNSLEKFAGRNHYKVMN